MRYTARTFLSAIAFWVAAAVLLANPLLAQTTKCGDICTETWTAAGNPYIVACDDKVTAWVTVRDRSGPWGVGSSG